MRILYIAAALAMLSGCQRDPDAMAIDGKVVCTLAGEAYFMRPNAGDTLFTYRTKESDALCAPLNEKQ